MDFLLVGLSTLISFSIMACIIFIFRDDIQVYIGLSLFSIFLLTLLLIVNIYGRAHNVENNTCNKEQQKTNDLSTSFANEFIRSQF